MKNRVILLCLALLLPLCTAWAEETAPQPEYQGYVYIEACGQFAWYPLPQTEEEAWSLPINMQDQEGNALQNVIHFSSEGVYMESSTCENQDCVNQGTVTLDNLSERILGGWIVCLPQQVTVQLCTPAEFYLWVEQYMAATNK